MQSACLLDINVQSVCMKNKTPVDGVPEGAKVVVPNRDRTARTRAALMDAARELFVEKGYGATSTPEIVKAASITRGALYHHFADKRDMFRAVLVREMEAVANEIRASAPAGLPPHAALLAGSRSYLQAMAVPGRTRLLLIEGPAALGLAEMQALDDSHAAATLAEGLAATGAVPPDMALDRLVPLLSAMFDRAALAIEGGAEVQAQQMALEWLLRRVVGAG